MLATLPFLRSHISAPIFYSVLMIIALGFFAGMTDPKRRGIIVGDALLSLVGLFIFTNEAIGKYAGAFDLYFLTNITLAVLFLFAFYWSVKTARVRGPFIKTDGAKNDPENNYQNPPAPSTFNSTSHSSKRNWLERTKQEIKLPTNAVPDQTAHPEKSDEERRKERFLRGD